MNKKYFKKYLIWEARSKRLILFYFFFCLSRKRIEIYKEKSE